jgi:hypothetical protein
LAVTARSMPYALTAHCHGCGDDDVGEFRAIAARLPAGCGLAAVLAAGFDGFEVIRAAARDCEDRDPALFGAFLLTAGAAVEGRNVRAAAPSLPPATGPIGIVDVPPGANPGQVAGSAAALAGLLAARLADAGLAAAGGDRRACAAAAAAARRIGLLLAGSGDECPPR